MQKVLTQYGEGFVLEKDDSGRHVSYLVSGPGFKTWVAASDMPIGFNDEEISEPKPNPEHELPYTVDPETDDFWGFSTIVPDEEDVEVNEERLEPSRPLDIEIETEEKIDPDSDKGKMLRDPEGFVEEFHFSHAGNVNPKVAAFIELCEQNEEFREAAWKDVQAKAARLRRESKVAPIEVTPRAIFASVTGDNGTYSTVVVRGGAVIGAGNITEWSCTCEWGKHAFVRKHTYVGRLCSHAYAAYLELQKLQKLDTNKDIQKHRKRKRDVRPYYQKPASLDVNYIEEQDDHWTEDLDEFGEGEETSTILINGHEANYPDEIELDDALQHQPFSGSGPAPIGVSNQSAGFGFMRKMEDILEDLGSDVVPVDEHSHSKEAGRKFTRAEQMQLINEANSDEEILSRLWLDGTHYVR